METLQYKDINITMESSPSIEVQLEDEPSIILEGEKEVNISLQSPEIQILELGDDLNVNILNGIKQNAKQSTLITGLKELKESIDKINLISVENRISSGISFLSNKINSIDLHSVKNKVDNAINFISNKIENINKILSLVAHESTLNEIKDKIDNIKLPEINTTELAKEATLNEVSSKLDNIKLPEIDTSAIAKQGENQDATNTAIYALLSQFGESVLQEDVTIVCNCAEDIAWEEYGIVITYADGTSQSLPMSENGTCSFSVKIGQEYSVQLPVIGAYIAPTLKTYTASTSSRQIYWSYLVSGVFGLDDLGRRYTIEQIEALEDKSIIKYGGYTDDFLENSSRDDGGVGNGFMWLLTQQPTSGVCASANVEFSQELLPFVTNINESLSYCNGAAYTRYMLSEASRLGITSPMAQECIDTTIIMQKEVYHGYIGAFQQYYRLLSNRTQITLLYSLVGIEVPSLLVNGGMYFSTSNQASAEKQLSIYTNRNVNKNGFWTGPKNASYHKSLPIFDLPK